jgi:signal peptidase
MRTVKTIVRLLAAGFAASALLLLLVVGIGPRTGRYQTATVLTGSMRPTMPEGSVVLTTPVPARDVRVGDIITYRIPVEDRRIVTHRVEEVLRGGDSPVVRTKGDANKDPDTWVAELTGGTVWKVRAAVPKAGYVFEWLRRPQARQLLVFVVPLLLALLFLRDIWRTAPEPAVTTSSSRPASRLSAGVALVALLSLGAAKARSG